MSEKIDDCKELFQTIHNSIKDLRENITDSDNLEQRLRIMHGFFSKLESNIYELEDEV